MVWQVCLYSPTAPGNLAVSESSFRPASGWPLSCATGQQTSKLVAHWGAVQELLLAPPLMHLAASSLVSAIPAWR